MCPQCTAVFSLSHTCPHPSCVSAAWHWGCLSVAWWSIRTEFSAVQHMVPWDSAGRRLDGGIPSCSLEQTVHSPQLAWRVAHMAWHTLHGMWFGAGLQGLPWLSWIRATQLWKYNLTDSKGGGQLRVTQSRHPSLGICTVSHPWVLWCSSTQGLSSEGAW